MLLAALRQMLRHVLAGLAALHPRPWGRLHGGGAGARLRRQGSDGEGVTIRVATFDAALFSMAPTGAKSVGPRPKGILKTPASPRSKARARVSIDVQEKEILPGSSPRVRSLEELLRNNESPKVRRQEMRRSVSEVLLETGADIIGLQNVRAEQELAELAGALGMRYVFAESNAVLTRWPISRIAGHSDDDDSRNMLRATIEVPGAGEVSFHCTHLKESYRIKQLDSMLRSSADRPHILAGSFNALDATDYSADRWADIVKHYEEIGKPTPKAEVMEYLKGRSFVDAKDFAREWENVEVVAKGQVVQGTCKYGTRVDYILASHNFPYKFVPGSYAVVSSNGTSDHHIVKVDFMIPSASSDSAVTTASTGSMSAPLTQAAKTTPVKTTSATEVVPPPEVTPATNLVELVRSNVNTATHHLPETTSVTSTSVPEVVPPLEESLDTNLVKLVTTNVNPATYRSVETTAVTSTGALEMVSSPEETPTTNLMEQGTTNVNPEPYHTAPAHDEEMAPASTIASHEATSVVPPSISTPNSEQIIEEGMTEVATDSAMLHTNVMEGDTKASIPDAMCTDIAPYPGGKKNGADTVPTNSTASLEQPISPSCFDLLVELWGEEAGRRKFLDELVHRIVQAQKRELDAAELEISQLNEKLELEQQKSERKITSAKLKALKAQEATKKHVRRVIYLEGELEDARKQIVEGKIKMSKLGEAIEAAQEVHDRVMDQLNKNEADAAKYAQSKVKELEALKIISAESQWLKDEELRKLTQANTQLVGHIGLVTLDLFGPESNLLTQPAGIQLMKIREFAPRVKVGVLEVFQRLMPEKDLPTSITEFLRKLSKIHDYVTHWKQSAARAGASRALSLAKAHHPNLNIDVISAGNPEKHEDGRPFTVEDYSRVEKPLRGFAGRLSCSVNVDKFFHHYQLDGTRTKATPTIGDATSPSTSTPTFTTMTRAANDPWRF